jgi:hypothetical protein
MALIVQGPADFVGAQFGAHISDFAAVRQWASMTDIGSEFLFLVIPAKAGIHGCPGGGLTADGIAMDPGFRRGDEEGER